MCCRLSVSPLDDEIAVTVLAVGMFVRNQADTWSRRIEEEDCSVIATLTSDALVLTIHPSISQYDHHHGKRITAGVYFEIAAKYAEKVDGEITQMSNVGECITDGVRQKMLAVYPEMPLLWERVCIGFQDELLGIAGS